MPAAAVDAVAANGGSAHTIAGRVAPSPLLSIDQNRATVVDRIVADWGDAVAASGAGLTKEQLRTLLTAMRADHLLAASLAGSIDGLRSVIANAMTTHGPAAADVVSIKVLGDTGDDLVYTPVTPCRLVETRGTFAAVYQGTGSPSFSATPFASNEIRNYTELGANGVCLSQLPAGLNPSAVQLQVFGIPVNTSASGDIEILPQGSTFGSTATLIYLGSIPFTSASATAKVNLANNQIGVQVRGGGANVAIDLLGYFKAPAQPIGTVSNVATGTGLTGGPITTTGTISIANLGVGTGQIAANAVTQAKLSPVSGGTAGKVLGTDGTNLVWQTPSAGTVTGVTASAPLASSGGATPNLSLSGSIPVANGGTGATTLTNNAVLIGQGTGAVTTSAGTTGQVLAGTGAAPAFTGSPSLSGNLALQNSNTPTVGNITKGGSPFIHNSGLSGSNTFVGLFSGNYTTSGLGNNTGLGMSALSSVTNGEGNTAVGSGALTSTKGGYENTAYGWTALTANVTGFQNTAIGSGALADTGKAVTAGSIVANNNYTILSLGTTDFTAIGASANTVGTVFFATGPGSGTGTASSNTFNNVAVGLGAMGANVTGTNSVVVGTFAAISGTTGKENVAIGAGALQDNIAGDSNTAVGTAALNNNTGTSNIGIGNLGGFNLTTGSNNIAIGHAGVAAENQTLRIGSSQTRTFVVGIRGTTTGAADAIPVVIDSNGQLGTVSSSRRFKDDIADMDAASEALMKLRPVTFHYKSDRRHDAGSLQYGLIAEEVAEVYPALIAHSADGRIETVMYQFLPAMLLNEFQKQQRTLQAQATEIGRQTVRIAELEQDRLAQLARNAQMERERELQAARLDALEYQAVEIAALKQQMAEMVELQRQAAALARAAGQSVSTEMAAAAHR